MRISGLYLKNWIIFAGEHYLKLDAKMYALVAKLDVDQERSNGLGKSALVESIAFALYNRHRFRTEDEFVARGEKSAEVRLEFDDGSVVTRSRQLGKTTRLWFRADGKDLYGPEAQAEIVRRVGLDEQDFVATCSFEQRQMARFVLSRPEERMAMISGWIGLAPLERAEAIARDRAAVFYDESDVLARRVDDTRARERDALGDFALIDGGLEGKIATLEAQLADARRAWKDARAARSAAEEVERSFRDAERYDAIVVEGKALAANVALLAVDVEGHVAGGTVGAHEVATAARTNAASEVKARRVVASGEFDGRCPIAEIECPARDLINADREVAKKALDEAIVVQQRAEAARLVSKTAVEKFEVVRMAHLQATTRLQSARKTALELQRSARAAAGQQRPKISELVIADELFAGCVVEVERELAGFRHRLATVERAVAERATILSDRAALDDRLAVAQAAVKIFGKNGAQRRIAEAALGQIESMANDMLAEAGIDLSVAVRWAREGKGLATSCDTCGAIFPASVRVKECARCREPRGPKLVHALELLLSWRSGAGEDLAGISVQLAASAWLRSSRGSAWSTALLDEAAGQLDEAHKKGFFAGASRMLSHAGFTQGILIAHSNRITDALPGRILVESDGGRSTVRVVA